MLAVIIICVLCCRWVYVYLVLAVMYYICFMVQVGLCMPCAGCHVLHVFYGPDGSMYALYWLSCTTCVLWSTWIYVYLVLAVMYHMCSMVQVGLYMPCAGCHLLHMFYVSGGSMHALCWLSFIICVLCSRWVNGGLVDVVVKYVTLLSIVFFCPRWVYVGLVLAVVYYMCFSVLNSVRQVRSVVGMFLFILIPYCLSIYPDKVGLSVNHLHNMH